MAINATSTSLVWRATGEDGNRYTVLLSAIALMECGKEHRWLLSPGGTENVEPARWVICVAGHHPLIFSLELGDSLHAAWMAHLETRSAK
jgi:hypothetical protein